MTPSSAFLRTIVRKFTAEATRTSDPRVRLAGRGEHARPAGSTPNRPKDGTDGGPLELSQRPARPSRRYRHRRGRLTGRRGAGVDAAPAGAAPVGRPPRPGHGPGRRGAPPRGALRGAALQPLRRPPLHARVADRRRPASCHRPPLALRAPAFLPLV